ncbi:cytochrome P450 [Annulohypoxylon truncatum]|uniref:cytochrome P450 n=1 Tax=Annulohypoxylon truncatum TaxID=327061 RepID=UPI0020080751|nr:cytochrome P450 [Annulohypoxylon truncatum]KAI1206912.1 cytochrome P450 [Annulohypoxylon truncatum]
MLLYDFLTQLPSMSTISKGVSTLSSTIVGYIVPAVLSWLFIYATYQIFLHPLHRYPGPLAAKLTDAYSGFYAFQRRLHLKTWQNQRAYGTVVRQGPNKLVFSTIKAIQDIYKNDRTTKPEAYIALGPALTVAATLTARDRHVHRYKRQLVGQALSERFMRIFEPTMINQVDLFITYLLQSAKESIPVNITERSKYLSFNLAGLLGFGYDFGMQTSEENKFMPMMLEAGEYWSNIFFQWPNTRKFRLGLVFVQVLRQTRGKYLALVEKMITSRTKQEKDAQQDLYSILAGSLDTGAGGLRQSELWAEANLFLPGAGDTTKTALSSIFFYLSRNPDCYEKLAHEIRSTFKDGSEIRGPALAGCHYLRACIDEALRMSPPAPGILWRDLHPGNDDLPFIVDGHVIPRGTTVGVNIYSIHHNEEYFPDPFSFHPERWLDDSATPERKKIMREAFIPFSLGPRGCAGKAMAYLEVSLVVAKTLWYFDFGRAPGGLGEIGAGAPGMGHGRERQGEFQLFDTFTASHDGPYLAFRSRDGLFS